MTEMAEFALDKAENIAEEGENSSYWHLLIFPQSLRT